MSYQPPAQDPKPPPIPPVQVAGSESLQSLQGRMRHPFRWGFVAGGVAAVAVALLIVQNGESVQVDWLWIDFRARLWIVLLLTVVAGGLIWESAKVAIRRAQASNKRRAEALETLRGQAAVKRRRVRKSS